MRWTSGGGGVEGETLLKVGVAMAAAAAVVAVSVFLAITLGTRDPDRAVAPAEIRAEEPAPPPTALCSSIDL